MNPTNPITTLRDQAAHIFGKFPVLFAYVYGSVADGSNHKWSDLDIAVYLENPGSPLECLNLELDLSLEIDALFDPRMSSEVRVINHLPLTIKGEVVTHGILVYCIQEDVRIEFETTVRKVYFDFLPVLNQYRYLYRDAVISG